ncbi:MAG: universal stress protein [Ferruginibacter sp.]
MSKKTILLLTDFSKISMRAADIALELAVNNQANLMIYNSIISIEASVIAGERKFAGDEIDLKTNKSKKNLDQLAQQLQARLTSPAQHKTAITVKQGMGSPVETMLNLVTENEIWMVVMGNHAVLNMSNQFFDSNVPSIMNNCGCPLLLVP